MIAGFSSCACVGRAAVSQARTWLRQQLAQLLAFPAPWDLLDRRPPECQRSLQARSDQVGRTSGKLKQQALLESRKCIRQPAKVKATGVCRRPGVCAQAL
jgi:hypothetical protein